MIKLPLFQAISVHSEVDFSEKYHHGPPPCEQKKFFNHGTRAETEPLRLARVRLSVETPKPNPKLNPYIKKDLTFSDLLGLVQAPYTMGKPNYWHLSCRN
jgi:hypothetical protein